MPQGRREDRSLCPGVRRALGTGLRKEEVCGQGGSLTEVSGTLGAVRGADCPGDFGI